MTRHFGNRSGARRRLASAFAVGALAWAAAVAASAADTILFVGNSFTFAA